MVMAAAVLGLAVAGIEVVNAATVGKTFPDFAAVWDEMVAGSSPGLAEPGPISGAGPHKRQH
jgi:3-phosphoshikimate 1-carboxyvinyltransferase